MLLNELSRSRQRRRFSERPPEAADVSEDLKAPISSQNGSQGGHELDAYQSRQTSYSAPSQNSYQAGAQANATYSSHYEAPTYRDVQGQPQGVVQQDPQTKENETVSMRYVPPQHFPIAQQPFPPQQQPLQQQPLQQQQQQQQQPPAYGQTLPYAQMPPPPFAQAQHQPHSLPQPPYPTSGMQPSLPSVTSSMRPSESMDRPQRMDVEEIPKERSEMDANNAKINKARESLSTSSKVTSQQSREQPSSAVKKSMSQTEVQLTPVKPPSAQIPRMEDISELRKKPFPLPSKVKKPPQAERLLCRVKMNNDMPDIPPKYKIVPMPSFLDRLARYDENILDKDYKYQIHFDEVEGVPIDFVDTSAFEKPEKPVELPQDDARLVNFKSIADLQQKEKAAKEERPAWLVKPMYVALGDGTNTFDEENKVSARSKVQTLVEESKKSYNYESICETFEAAKDTPKHPEKKPLMVRKVIPLLPDKSLWDCLLSQVVFDLETHHPEIATLGGRGVIRRDYTQTRLEFCVPKKEKEEAGDIDTSKVEGKESTEISGETSAEEKKEGAAEQDEKTTGVAAQSSAETNGNKPSDILNQRKYKRALQFTGRLEALEKAAVFRFTQDSAFYCPIDRRIKLTRVPSKAFHSSNRYTSEFDVKYVIPSKKEERRRKRRRLEALDEGVVEEETDEEVSESVTDNEKSSRAAATAESERTVQSAQEVRKEPVSKKEATEKDGENEENGEGSAQDQEADNRETPSKGADIQNESAEQSEGATKEGQTAMEKADLSSETSEGKSDDGDESASEKMETE